jgi:hypothetical protein
MRVGGGSAVTVAMAAPQKREKQNDIFEAVTQCH